MTSLIGRFVEPLRNRLLLLIAKAIVTRVNDSENIQIVQINLGNNEVIDGVERIQNFGFSSNPVNGSPAIVLCLGGERSHPIVIVTDSKENRPDVSSGDSVMYNSSGTKITLEGNKAIIDAANIELGTGIIQKLVNESFMTLFNSHTHICAAPASPSAPPVPLMTDLNLTSKTKAE